MTLPGPALSLALSVLVIGFTGCTTYNYTQQKDSAYVRGTDSQKLLNLSQPRTYVGIMDIDGASVGMTWNSNSGEYVSAGKHQILLGFNPSDQTYANMKDLVEADFTANHTYQFSISSDSVDITLWDETAGADKSVSVASWNFGGADAPAIGPIENVDFNTAQYVRPPLDSRNAPPHIGRPAGPPSIPHNPRPKSGGGHQGGSQGKKK